MRDRLRSSRFWQGPGLLVAFVTLILAGGLLAVFAALGPPWAGGVVMVVVGLAAIWAREGIGELAYAGAQRSYIWPRDPERMKPNAELEGGWGKWFAVVFGVLLVISGVAQVIEELG